MQVFNCLGRLVVFGNTENLSNFAKACILVLSCFHGQDKYHKGEKNINIGFKSCFFRSKTSMFPEFHKKSLFTLTFDNRVVLDEKSDMVSNHIQSFRIRQLKNSLPINVLRDLNSGWNGFKQLN